MTRKRTLSGVLIVAAVAATPAAAALRGGPASSALLWQNKSKSVTCGIEIHAPKKPATMLLCVSKGIPRPPKGGPAGDPFVQIAANGKAQLVLISQQSWVAGSKKPTTLATGATWSKLGVTCTIDAKTVTCTNKSKHGFTIGNGKYKAV
jgi:hypothetical protein